ncbi:RNA polymerase sigma-70 factor, ECF subfamily [Hymenobacter daecheongensis DSM 21074]|uniref:RNA polymerase sigma-70 factor, ECF subfamily n=1 Tax=Hymenobacter daecheongensis DSM 21074 TaxID=1121955 RepID=A0A1M6HYP5_9BACT|nr:sigma-70 family RNA polymerase sigma factor [Hymenobacter daecheongensis]SHJ27224.1 RNA polymerase sigma-70 factor, ECF subfamily [Hymenobacter daecheongensis DSM 21074]
MISPAASRASEQELVQRLYARDEAAMTLFYDGYGRALYNTIWRIVKSEELAEDVLQEGMVKIWFSFASYDPDRGRLFTWALNICRNVAIDHIRTRRHQAAARTEELHQSAARHQAAAPTFQPEHIGLRELVARLSPPDQQLIDLLYFNGFTQAEAAEALNLPLGTVKTRIRRAICELAQATR